MEIAKKIFLISIIFFIFLFITILNKDLHLEQIKNWVSKHNMKIIDYEINQTVFGSPFYYLNDDCFIYKVDVKTQRGEIKRLWVRDNGLLNDDYIME